MPAPHTFRSRHGVADGKWRLEGGCSAAVEAGDASHWWWAPPPSPATALERGAARAICAKCPVRVECGDAARREWEALGTAEEDVLGIRAGMDANQRRTADGAGTVAA